jgi:hypothetical protein
MRNKDKFLLHLYNTNRLVDYSYEILFLSEIYDHMPFYLIFYTNLLSYSSPYSEKAFSNNKSIISHISYTPISPEQMRSETEQLRSELKYTLGQNKNKAYHSSLSYSLFVIVFPFKFSRFQRNIQNPIFFFSLIFYPSILHTFLCTFLLVDQPHHFFCLPEALCLQTQVLQRSVPELPANQIMSYW